MLDFCAHSFREDHMILHFIIVSKKILLKLIINIAYLFYQI